MAVKFTEVVDTPVMPYSEVWDRAQIRKKQIKDIALESDKFNQERIILDGIQNLCEQAIVLQKSKEEPEVQDAQE